MTTIASFGAILASMNEDASNVFQDKGDAAVLVATLGTEPQIVSLAAQSLTRGAAPIERRLDAIVVLHTNRQDTPIGVAVSTLETLFAAHPRWPPLRLQHIPDDDVVTPEQISTFADVLYAVLRVELQANRRVHLLLSGGRKPMSMVGLTVAQLLFGPQDRVWLLQSEEQLRLSRRALLQPDDEVVLMEVPLPNLHLAPPVFTRTMQAPTRDDALRTLAQQKQSHHQRFVEVVLTPAEREVVALVAQEVLTTEAVASRLHKSPKTVTNQLNTIYSKLEAEFDLHPDHSIKREFLRRELRNYFENTKSTG
ncbi:LuxR C-terminal-related transcriptional regulator [Chloroflexi bacterium TSY]|nr:LuxR C-terminal-related transcriptional regulator [Chloroflexi bacterium TSY]